MAPLKLPLPELPAGMVGVDDVGCRGLSGGRRRKDLPEQASVVVVVPVVERAGPDCQPALDERVPQIPRVADCGVQRRQHRRAGVVLGVGVARRHPTVGVVTQERYLPGAVGLARQGGEPAAHVGGRWWGGEQRPGEGGRGSHRVIVAHHEPVGVGPFEGSRREGIEGAERGDGLTRDEGPIGEVIGGE